MQKPPSPEPHRPLKIMVISMGIVLIAGTLLLFAIVFERMQGVTEASAAKPAQVPDDWRDCGAHTLPLGADETIMRIGFDEAGITRIITRLPGGARRIRWVHGCSGDVVGRLTIGE